MTRAGHTATTRSDDSHVTHRTGDLLRIIESLREQVESLEHQNSELAKRLSAAELGSQTDRQSRRAALNLMEDAVRARRAEQHELAERRRVEEELRKADRRKDEFLATLAHELRNPLAPIRNSVHLLRLTGTDPAAAERIYEMLDRQVAHMVRLVDDLMEVSRITRGKIELRKDRVELGAIIRSAVEISKPLIQSGGQELELDLPTEPLFLDADPVRLTQVLANLLNNAAKFTPEGGRIWLKAGRLGAEAVITVRDSGIGIPTDMISRVFDLFIQGDHTHHRATGGLGIGLTLVQRLVQLHGGNVEVKSDGPGHGSQFIVTLPLTHHAAQAGHRPANSPLDMGTRRILVVDDNIDAADSLGMLLKFLGADISIAHDGQMALKLLVDYRPSVILLDIGMPDIDGYETARRIRRLPEGQGVLLIALTGWGQAEDRQRSVDAGFDQHLVKPVDLGALQMLLNAPSDDRGREQKAARPADELPPLGKTD